MFHCSDSRALLILCRPYRASQSPVGTTDIQRRWSHAEPLPQPAGGQPLRVIANSVKRTSNFLHVSLVSL